MANGRRLVLVIDPHYRGRADLAPARDLNIQLDARAPRAAPRAARNAPAADDASARAQLDGRRA